MRHEQRHVSRPLDEEPETTINENKAEEEFQNTANDNHSVKIQPSNSSEASTTNEKSENEIEHNETEVDIIMAESTFQVLKKETISPFNISHNFSSNDSNFPQIPHPQATLETLEEFIIHLNKRQRKALKYLKKNNSIKNKIYRKIGEVSHKTAHIELTEMLHYGLIRSQGSGRSTHYVLNR